MTDKHIEEAKKLITSSGVNSPYIDFDWPDGACVLNGDFDIKVIAKALELRDKKIEELKKEIQNLEYELKEEYD